MSDSGPIWLSEADVTELVSLKDALECLEQGLRWEGQGKAFNIPKAMGRWGDGGVTNGLGAMFPEAGFVGWKTWSITKLGGAVSYELFDGITGALLAVIEAIALGQMRTAAMSGLGAKWLAPVDADTLAMVGAGRQALAQVAAITAVRPLSRVTVYSRGEDRRQAFAEILRGQFDFAVEVAPSLEAAVGDSAITTLITRAQEPFLTAMMLPRGAHLNAVGAILPTHAEFTGDVFDRAGAIVVDSLPDTKKASREFIERFGEGDWSPVRNLGSLVAESYRRPESLDLTVFKAMGMGVSDLSVAAEVYRRARAQGRGQALGAPKPSKVRWA